MKNLRVCIGIFAVIVCLVQTADAENSSDVLTSTVREQNDINDVNDVNKPIMLQRQADKINSDGSSNEPAAGKDLLDVVAPEGPNVPPGYISGDAFNLGFSNILKEYVDSSGLVNYPKLRRYRLVLNDAAEKMANLKPEVYITWSKNEKIAFWINAYNICTLKGIIQNYPINPSRFMLLFYPADSVMHIDGLRDKTYFMIMGIQYTLEEIERDVLLGRFTEPRACFAVCYGTISGGPLRAEPYLGKVLDKQLDEQIKNYFAKSDAFKIDDAKGTVYLSSVFGMYKWRQDAFLARYGTNKLFREYNDLDRAVLNFVKDYISEQNAEILKRKQYSIEYIKYNWQLNEQPAENK
jgi:hypothetical protein